MVDLFASEQLASQIKNWKLPYNHLVSLSDVKRNFANTYKAAKLAFPQDPEWLNKELGGQFMLHRHELRLYTYTKKLRDA
jgi:hypothetical protein